MARRRRTSSNLVRFPQPPKRPPRDLRQALSVAGSLASYATAFTVEQAAVVARERVAWHGRRAQITESHRRRSQLSDPGMVQERHSPTVEIAVDDPEAKKRTRRNLTRVRQSEAWRHNQLSAMQRQAENEMATVWRVLTSGLAPTGSTFTPRFGQASNDHSVLKAMGLERTWREFVPELRRRRIPRFVVLDLLIEPLTLRQVELAYRLQRGRAQAIYQRALDCWCELRGWLRASPSINGVAIGA